ncbi:flavin reductase [Nocardioides sp. cx-173]|uniref:flavin reductase n=1 Tax=Nocardioides sp. cx-173 TaxID=2898796 RepID=UPI001E430F7E|nr:flavin reductase [Nocardioides sp. cx-173]MCD4526612.1 flavin reductase [Nocardioides sp. cx-173]UGB40705.1 flavin reductase [Nocardioides sp. cx-173]
MGDDATPTIDAATFREVMGHYPTGVAVVTGFDGDEPVGMVVGTFSAVSLDPPLVTFMPTRGSGTYARLRNAPSYCINVLAHDQLELCRTMAAPRPDKFDGVAWETSPYGAPMLSDAVAHVHCVDDTVVEAGDHDIVLCRVLDMAVSRPATPLLFFQGGYGGFNPRGMAAQGDAELISAIRLAESARRPVERLAERLGCEAACLVQISPDELTTAISSYAGDASMSEHLGRRLPLMPPIGEAWVAGAPDEVVERWLSRALPQEPEVVERYRQRLETVRTRGAALSIIGSSGHEQYEALSEALIEYASGQATPARERALRAQISQFSSFYETLDIVDDEVYDLGSIVVPVRDPSGAIVMTLRVRQLPRGVTGRTVNEWIDLVKDAAAGVERDLAGPGATAHLHDYHAWYDGDFPGLPR